MSYFVYVSNNYCHRVTTQLQLINIIIIIIIVVIIIIIIIIIIITTVLLAVQGS